MSWAMSRIRTSRGPLGSSRYHFRMVCCTTSGLHWKTFDSTKLAFGPGSKKLGRMAFTMSRCGGPQIPGKITAMASARTSGWTFMQGAIISMTSW